MIKPNRKLALAVLGASITVGAFPSWAQLDSETATFTATVNEQCDIQNFPATTTLLETSSSVLGAESTAFSVVSNAPVNLQLSNLTVNSEPNGATFTWTARLVTSAGGSPLAEATVGNDSALVNYANGINTNDLKIGMYATSGTILVPGNYSASVTLDCLSVP
jgi:hypothetical protein